MTKEDELRETEWDGDNELQRNIIRNTNTRAESAVEKWNRKEPGISTSKSREYKFFDLF